MDHDAIVHNFTYHAPTPETVPVFETIRGFGKSFALWLESQIPDSRERALAITKIEEAVFWANAAVARNP